MGIAALALSNLATSLFGGLLALVFIRKLHPTFRIRIYFVTAKELAALWAVAGYFQLVRIAYIVAVNTDPLIIAAFLGASQVTPYVITIRMATMFSVVLADKAPSAVYPAFAQMYARGEMERLKASYLTLVYYSTRLAMVGVVLVGLLNSAFVSCWVGKQAYGGMALNSVFVYCVLFDTILRGSSLIPLVTGDMKVWAFTSVAEAIANVGLSLLLIRPFGVVGVALGTAVARTCLTGAIMPVWSCRKLGIKFSHLAFRGVLRPILKSLAAIGITVLVAWIMPVGMTWFRLCTVGVVAVVANFAIFEGPKWMVKPTWSIRALISQMLKPELAASETGISD
jgi:O-antigen/teichoic acid export membrane protein